MHFKVRTFNDSAGDEMSVLVDSNNQPFFWPNVFATMEFRHKSPKTLSAVLRSLGMFELWTKSKGFADSNDLAKGSTIAMHEAEDLAKFLRLTRPAQDQEATITNAERQKKVARLEKVRRSKPQTNNENPYANSIEAANRIRWVAKFLEFLRDRSLSACNDHNEQRLIEKKANIAINRLRKLAPRGGSFAENESLVGVDESVISLVSNTLDPARQSQNNPFANPFLQARNFLIWSLLAETGARREELVKLKVDDIDYSTRRVRIRESKTLPRTVPISAKTAQVFHNFIMEYWSKLPAKRTKHGQLIISETGQPLTTGTINQIFTQIRKIPGVPDYLTPHTLRRSWNERYSAKIDALPAQQRPSVQEETEIRNRLMGWSAESKMGARYAKRHIRRKADLIAEDLANTLTNTEVPSDD